MTRFRGLAAAVFAAFFPRYRPISVMAAVVLFCLGCKSDLSQQLLERELRMQEDQIYQLQDELQDKCARLDRVAGENTSLKKQLGFGENDGPSPRRGPLLPPGGQPAPAIRSGPSQPQLVPPAIDIPGVVRPPAGGPATPPTGSPPAPGTAPGTIGPPKLDGIPPLPTEPRFPGAAAPNTSSSVTPASATVAATGDPTGTSPARIATDSAARPMASLTDPTGDPPAGQRLSHEESLADAGRITHLIVNPRRTACFDGDGDGVSDGLAIVIEPRDGDERLVTAAGDVSISSLTQAVRPARHRWHTGTFRPGKRSVISGGRHATAACTSCSAGQDRPPEGITCGSRLRSPRSKPRHSRPTAPWP